MSRGSRWVLGAFSAFFAVMLVVSRLRAPSVIDGRVHLMAAFCFVLTIACFSDRWRETAVRVIGAMLFVAIAFFIKDELRAQSAASYNGDYEPHWFNAIGAALLFALPALYVAITGRFPTLANMPYIGKLLRPRGWDDDDLD
jgi:hypothetical protein